MGRMIELPGELQSWFLESGWTKSHLATVPESIPRNHPAHSVLTVFGGITLLERNSTSDDDPTREFTFRPFSSTPRKIRMWAHRLQTTLFGIADEHNCHAELYMDEKGRCFSNSLIHDCFAFAGESFVDTLLGSLQQRRHRGLIHPLQSNVRIYGETIERGDPRIWDYRINR